MAAGFFNQLADPAGAVGIAAGTQPAARVHPEVVASMREVGIDLRHAAPRRLTPDLAREATWLVTMGCGEECPLVPGVRREDWALRDPKGQSPDVVRAIREELRAQVEAFADRERYAAVPIEEAGRHAIPAIVSFLAGHGLPEAGLAEHGTDFLVALRNGGIVATAALEVYGTEALLRSVAVDASLRGTGLGARLARAAIRRARRRGVSRLFLLTETAAGFFPKFGFRAVERGDVPESIRSSVEFASACPASARVMALDLS